MNICELIESQNNIDDTSDNNNNVNNSDNDETATTTTTEITTETATNSSNVNTNSNNNDDGDLVIHSITSDDSASASAGASNSEDDDNNNNASPHYMNNDENFDDLFILDKFFKLCEAQKFDLSYKYLMPSLESCATHDEYMKVFAHVRNACFYNDVMLRSIWIEQIPNVVQYFRNQNLLDENLNTEIAIIISNLMQYTSYQVRKIASATLVLLIERNLIETSKIEQYIIPCLLNLVNENNDDINIECVSLFGKLAPLIGRELTVKHLLVPFCRLCSSPVFHTRKVCATNIGEIATIVSNTEVEEFLLPHFSDFIKDQVWAIRKVCAEIFANIANKCTRSTRESILTECFIRLLEDSSRWVKISAYKTLGSFIATFLKDENDLSTTPNSSSSLTPRQLDQNDAKKFYNNNKNDKKVFLTTLLTTKSSSSSGNSSNNNSNQQSLSIRLENEEADNETSTDKTTTTTTTSFDKKHETSQKLIEENNYVELQTATAASGDGATTSTQLINNGDMKSLMQYSNFLYWRDSLPELRIDENDETRQQDELEIEIDDDSSEDLYKAEKNRNRKQTQLSQFRDFYGQLSNTDNNSYIETQTAVLNYSTSPPNEQQSQLNDELNEQDIVPPRLLGYFITMVDMNAQTSLDSEMNYNCAFNFPAIAHTLGASYWKYIRDLYIKLAEDVNWKVRQTLAYSIHELAQILGTEVAQTDLIPIFDSYIKDVDEVRIGIVSNLSKFLRMLRIEYRQAYMPKLIDFLKMDNQRNWRFRNELGLQICEFVDLFPAECISKFIQPVAFTLALDKVAEVRLTAVAALTQILKQFVLLNETSYRKNFVEDTVRTFANNEKWTFRQLYTTLCSNILEHNADNFTAFSCDFLPHLLSLRHDRVPNIRLSLARVLATYLSIFQSLSNSYKNELALTIESLSHDPDSDVHSFFKSSQCSSPTGNYDDEPMQTTDNNNTTTSSKLLPSSTTQTTQSAGINVNLLNDSLNDFNEQQQQQQQLQQQQEIE